MASTISPNMGLVVPGVGTEAGPNWAVDINASLASIDSHNHSAGQGVQITPNGLNINAMLPFNGQQATGMGAILFNNIASLATVNALYVINGDLWYNDVTAPVQITASGLVNATSSGISNGTASAAFSAGVLVVKSTSTSGANVLMQSAVLTNSGNLTNQLTLQAPTLSGSITETLPLIPGAASFVQIDTSGNMSASIAISGGITGSNIASATVTGTKIAANTVARSNLVSVGQQISSSCGNQSGLSNTSYVNVNNLTITITTSGRPVILMIQPDGTANQSFIFVQGVLFLDFFNSTSAASVSTLALTGPQDYSTNYIVLDAPAAGTYTYVVRAKVNSSTYTIAYAKMVAYEL